MGKNKYTTSLLIDREIHQRLKLYAAAKQTTMGRTVEEALEEYFRKQEEDIV